MIFQVTGANQNTQKLLSTDLVNTNIGYIMQINLHLASVIPAKLPLT